MLRRTGERPPHLEAPGAASGDTRPLRVVVVEDDAVVAFLVQDLLTEMGCEVAGSASTVAEALRMTGGEHPDFALLDVNLGAGRTSFEVADRLLEWGVPFAFVTGYGEGGVPEAYRAAPVVEKPIDPRALRRAIDRLA